MSNNLKIKKEKFILQPKWRLIYAISLGCLFGITLFIFYISKASSYLSDDPSACINCHIMIPQYATWFHSSHREWATCNDCHIPHENIFSKYYFKATGGLRHASIFTLGLEPQVIRINEKGKSIVQNNCIRCT